MDDFSVISTPVELRPPPAPTQDWGAISTSATDIVGRAKAVTMANSYADPKAAGQAAEIGRQIGLPQAAVETDIPSFSRQAKTSQNLSVLDDNPILAKWVSAKPDAARIAHDEYEKLGAMEKLWTQTGDFGYGMIKGLGGSYNSLMHAAALQFGATDQAARLEDEAKTSFSANPNATFGEKSGEFVGGFAGIMSQAVLGAEALTPILSAFGVASTAGALSAGQATGVLPIIGQAATQSVRYMSIPAWSAAVNKFHEVLGQTGDLGAAASAAAVTQGMTLMQGAVPFSLPGNLGTRALSGAVSGLSISEGQRAALNLVLPESMQQPFDMKEAVSQAAQSALLGGLMGPRASPNFQAAIRQTYVDAAKASIAQRDLAKVATLGQISAGLEVRKADPDAFKKFVEELTDKSDLNSIYVDGNKLQTAYAQSGIEIPAEIHDQMKSAASTGGDVQIPIADYATHIAGTEVEKAILPDMKVEPDGMTMTQGRKFYQEQVAKLQVEAQKIHEQKQQDEHFQASGQKVEDTLLAQLNESNRFRPEVNKLYAKLMRSFFETRAIRETEMGKARQAGEQARNQGEPAAARDQSQSEATTPQGEAATKGEAINNVEGAGQQASAPDNSGASTDKPGTATPRSPELQNTIDMRKRQSILESIRECMG